MALTETKYRYEASGLISTETAQLGFCPKWAFTRDPAGCEASDIALWPLRGSKQPSTADISECVAAISRRFPNRRIYAEQNSSLTLVYEPVPARFEQFKVESRAQLTYTPPPPPPHD